MALCPNCVQAAQLAPGTGARCAEHPLIKRAAPTEIRAELPPRRGNGLPLPRAERIGLVPDAIREDGTQRKKPIVVRRTLSQNLRYPAGFGNKVPLTSGKPWYNRGLVKPEER